MEVEETSFVEKSVNGINHCMAHPENCTEGICTHTEVCNFAQEFEAVAFWLQWIFVGIGFANHFNFFSNNFNLLLTTRLGKFANYG